MEALGSLDINLFDVISTWGSFESQSQQEINC